MKFDTAPPAATTTAAAGETWPILIVDDEPLVHVVTQIALRDLVFEGLPLSFHSAYTTDEARAMLERMPGTAVAFIDVVFAHGNDGLVLIDHIRNEVGNRAVQIIVRTGQPGVAPERDLLRYHEIDAYIDKARADSARLFAATWTALRAYRELARLRRAIGQLEALVATDPLTGLLSKRVLLPSLARTLAGTRRRREPLSVVFLDIDAFKEINDRRGHMHGDAVLQSVAEVLVDCSRANDMCFRYAGDEFLTVLPDCTAEAAVENFCRRVDLRFAALGVDVSYGVAQTLPSDSLSPEELIQGADADMYRRKIARKSGAVSLAAAPQSDRRQLS